MESHIKNLFQHGIRHFDRKTKKLDDNVLGCSVFAQRYSPSSKSFWGVELAPKFFELWNDIGRPEIITYSRIEEDEKGNPVTVTRKNTSVVGFAHEEQGLCMVFNSEDTRNDAMERIIEAYPAIEADHLIAKGEFVEKVIGVETMEEFLDLENISTMDELGRPVSPAPCDLLFINVGMSIEGKGLYWSSNRATNSNKPQVSTTPEQEPTSEEVNF